MAEVSGVNLPDELYYQPEDHLWVRLEGNRARVGLDDLAQKSAGKVSAVRLKPAGRPIAQGKPFGTLEAGKYVGPLKAPVSGPVLEVNAAVMSTPGLLNSDPYGQGWLVVIQLENPEPELAALKHGPELADWLAASVADWRQRGLLKNV